MSKAREKIFQRLTRQSSQPPRQNDSGPSLIESRLSAHERALLPVLPESVHELFISKVEQAAASVECIKNISELAQAVSEYLSLWNLERRLVAASTDVLKQLSWPDGLEIEYRAAISSDITSLCVAYAGIAETGSLVLCSGRDTPTTLNFLPDNYICVVRRDDIYPYMEDIWSLLREEGGPPRAINFITGPSRTADVEQTIQLGAHGPRRVHVIIMGVGQ